MARGLTAGLMVCRYAFKRLPGQPPLVERDDEEADVEAVAEAEAEAKAENGEGKDEDEKADGNGIATIVKTPTSDKVDKKPKRETKPPVESPSKQPLTRRRSSRRSGALLQNVETKEPSPAAKPLLAKRKLEASPETEEPPVKRRRRVVVELGRRVLAV